MAAADDHDFIYLDNAATTRVADEVLRAVQRVQTRCFGNPSSRHKLGLEADREVRRARGSVARRVGVEPRQVVFTSGGTEALALALHGTARRRKRPGHILLSAIEHAAVTASAQMLAQMGHRIESIPVGPGGCIDPDQVMRQVGDQTFLVAVMHVNNEVGTVQPIEQIAARLKGARRDCLLLVDAVQSYGILDTDMTRLGADLLALSGHKLHGPKGTGALVLAEGVTVEPLWRGGSQERGLRAGTENVPGIVGLGVAAELGKGDPSQLATQRDLLVGPLLDALPEASVLGDPQHRAPHIAAVGLPNRRSDVIVNALSERSIYVSSGSACYSQRSKRSHVLEAMGVAPQTGVIRISLSSTLSEDQISRAAQIIAETASSL